MSIGHQAVFPKGNALRGTTCASLTPGDGKTLYQTRDCVNTWLIHFLLAREFTWAQQLTSGQARGRLAAISRAKIRLWKKTTFDKAQHFHTIDCLKKMTVGTSIWMWKKRN
ncbi:MAG: hypothetical protein LBQ69_01675 [Treponema sp.]|jgi:hypothetical protein|nr:hypothetical protein [Treponema sp.]